MIRQAAVCSVMEHIRIPINIDWCRQDSRSVAKVFSMVSLILFFICNDINHLQ
jgi:hypothetical protein